MKRTVPQYKMDREMVLSAANLSAPEARFLVANYYASQDMRKRLDGQMRHLGDKAGVEAVNEDGEKTLLMPTVLTRTANIFATIEGDVQRALKKFAEGTTIGQWCLSQHGVAAVITAGLLAHLDIEKAPTVGHFWRFAGLDPSAKWKKGEKRPFNRELRQICWHMGQNCKLTSNHPDAFYGRIYRSRKELLVLKNEAGKFAERAKSFFTKSLEAKKTLASGKLPAGNLDSQACNFAAKIFLSHLHAVMYWDRYQKAPPKPFAISILGHAHEIKIPNTDEIYPGFSAAYYGDRKCSNTRLLHRNLEPR